MTNTKLTWFTPGRKMGGLAFILMGALALAGVSAAQESNPAVRAARLSDVEGQVQLSQGNQVMASQAPINAPLFEGTQITSSEDGRAEVQFDDGSVARVSPNSSITISVLRQQAGAPDTEVIVNSGLAYFEIQNSTQPDSFRVRFGDSVATGSGFTVLRVNVDNPPGEVAVFSGNAQVSGANSMAADVHGGEEPQAERRDAGQLHRRRFHRAGFLGHLEL